MATSPFVIKAEDVRQMLSSSPLMSMEDLLRELVALAKTLARPPISQYHVGAVGLGSSGRIFLGVNLEFEGFPLSNSVHAEQFLVVNAMQHEEPSLRMIAVSAAPCGHCRQFLQELRDAPDVRVLIVDADAETQTLDHFLPHRFGPNDVLEGEFPLILEHHANGLCIRRIFNKGSLQDYAAMKNAYTMNRVKDRNPEYFGNELANGHVFANDCMLLDVDKDVTTCDLTFAALEAANRSHAPYTNCPAGVALLTRDGKIHSGSYLESAAYNPSLPPLQAALVNFVAGDGGSYQDITKVVIVEKEGAPVQFAASAELLLKKISPSCIFQTCHASIQEA